MIARARHIAAKRAGIDALDAEANLVVGHHVRADDRAVAARAGARAEQLACGWHAVRAAVAQPGDDVPARPQIPFPPSSGHNRQQIAHHWVR